MALLSHCFLTAPPNISPNHSGRKRISHMQVSISKQHLRQIEAHGEATYPNEGAGFILGRIQQDVMVIHSLLAIENKREAEAQYNRYELTPHDYAQSEIA